MMFVIWNCTGMLTVIRPTGLGLAAALVPAVVTGARLPTIKFSSLLWLTVQRMIGAFSL